MTHKHDKPFKWLPSKRIHKRPPRLFKTCSVCGKDFQGVINADGTFHDFATNWKKNTGKRSRTFWVSDTQARTIRMMLKSGEL